MNRLIICLFLPALAFVSCKTKRPDSTKAYFSVVDYLKGEVKKMDTLPLAFMKITTGGTTSDTVKSSKQEFDRYARQFTDLPDIASTDNMDDYTETNDFEESLGNVLLMYSAKKLQSEVRSETVMMEPDENGNTHVKTILANTMETGGDSTVVRDLTWHVGKRFQIVSKVNKPKQPEKISTVVISWE